MHDSMAFAITVYAAPVVLVVLIAGVVRRTRWTLPALIAYLAWCLVAVGVYLAGDDSYLGDGTSVWQGGDIDARPWLLLLGLGTAATAVAAAAVQRRSRPATDVAAVAVAGGWLVSAALLVVAIGYGLH